MTSAGGDVVDVRAPALGEERAEPREVAAVRLERVAREAALDLEVIEEQVDRLVEAQPARHAPIARRIGEVAQVFQGLQIVGRARP